MAAKERRTKGQSVANRQTPKPPGFLGRGRLWLFGVVTASLTSMVIAVLTGQFSKLSEPIAGFISTKACELVHARHQLNQRQFVILLSPLSGDKDGSQTSRVMNAFHGEGFNVAPICEQLRFDTTKDLQSAEEDTKKAWCYDH